MPTVYGIPGDRVPAQAAELVAVDETAKHEAHRSGRSRR